MGARRLLDVITAGLRAPWGPCPAMPLLRVTPRCLWTATGPWRERVFRHRPVPPQLQGETDQPIGSVGTACVRVGGGLPREAGSAGLL